MSYEIKKLGDLCEVVTKGTTPTTLGYNFTNEGIPFLRAQNLINGRVNIEVDPLYINEETHKALKRSIIKPGDMLIAIAGTIGRTAIVQKEVEVANCNQAVAIVRTNDILNARFLQYSFGSNYVLRQVAGSKVTATISNLSLGKINELKIPLPPLPTQKKIVEILDAAQRLIDTRKAQIAEMDALVQSLFYDMFGDPVSNPMGWNVKKLGEIVSIKHGFAFKSEYFVESGDFVLLTPGNFYESGGFRNRGEKQRYYSGKFPQEYLLNKGDMLVAMTEQAPGLLGSPILIPEAGKFLHNQRLGLVQFDKDFANELFLFYYFNTANYRQELQFTSTGSKVKHTSPTKIQAVTIPLPPIDLQNTFADRVQKIEAQKAAMQSSLSELEDNFNALMQRAFKGELV